MNSGYLFELIKGTEVIVGVLLLTNRFVPLALALIAPVIVHIVAFHAFLAPTGMVIPLALVAVELYLAWHYRARVRPMLAARAMLFNRSAPHDRIVPVLIVADVRVAVAWYGAVFGFVEYVQIGEGHRAQLGLGGAER